MITIIVPAHNERINLESLLPQLIGLSEACSVEILVALSSENLDESETILNDEKVKFINCSVKGRAAQMNRAAEHALGNVLVFLHADVRPPKSFLMDIDETLADGYDAGFFSYRFDKKNFFLRLNASFTSKDGIFTGGGDQCLFIKKEVFNDLGRFDESQVLMEDFEFFERMKRKDVRYTIIKNDLIVSARKYRDNSYLRVNLSNMLLLSLFKLGYPAKKLKSLHDRLLRIPYDNNS